MATILDMNTLHDGALYLHSKVVIAMALVFGLLIWSSCLAVYRLCFGRLAGFPGRKLAALTGWYEFYHQVIKDGSYVWEVQRTHDRYGKHCGFQCLRGISG